MSGYMGRDAGRIRAGCLQLQHASHGVFHQKTAAVILIVRLLHHRQLPDNHL